MSGQYFTRDQANAKVGKRIESLYDFSGVPKGTTGVVVGTYGYGSGEQWSLSITWDIQHNGRPITDGFSKDEYMTSLKELK